MRALKFTEPLKAEYIDEPEPRIEDDQLLIKVAAVGICHSDVMAYEGKHPWRVPPVVTGHEFSGTVVKVGAGVRGFAAGDRVCVEPHIGCGTCAYCREGSYNLCKTKRFLGVGAWTGCFAEYAAAYPSMCVKLPDSMSFEEGALMEPLAVGVHAVESAGIPEGASAAVLGCGTIGMMTLGAIMSKKPGKVFVSEVSESKRKMALELGAAFAVDPMTDDLSQVVMDNTGGSGVDFVFVTVPVPQVLKQALTLARKKGTVVVVAVFDKPVDLEIQQIQVAERRVIGSNMYVGADYRTAMEHFRAGKLPLARFITKRIGFSELAEHVDRLSRGELKDEIKIIASL